MKKIIDLTHIEAFEFLLKEESYSNIVLPHYFSFQRLIDKTSKKLKGKNLKDFRTANPRDFEDINYTILSNKDGKYAWRPFELINPALYVSLVHKLTEENNWKLIQQRFKEFGQNSKIECHSLPICSTNEKKTNTFAQILTWWEMIEQRSLVLSLDYKFVMHTDISDCYSSIYTHSIPWSLHSKGEAKKKENRTNNDLIGVVIDNHIQDMSYGQTNGIPQGSTIMDFIAEMVLGYIDLLLSERLEELKITEYKILRYRDDYRIFSNNNLEAELITKELSETLTSLGLKLNADKTEASSDVIKSSIKHDKRYWIENKRIAENKQKWLIQIYLLSEKFPNSGTVDTQMRDFLKIIEKSTKVDPQTPTLISLVTEIAIKNPRVIPSSIGSLSLLLNNIKDEKLKTDLLNKIKYKFQQVPNSTFIMIWFQRLNIKMNGDQSFNEPLCNRVQNGTDKIWNSDWLNGGLKEILDDSKVVVKSKLEKTKPKISKKEIKTLVSKTGYYE